VKSLRRRRADRGKVYRGKKYEKEELLRPSDEEGRRTGDKGLKKRQTERAGYYTFEGK